MKRIQLNICERTLPKMYLQQETFFFENEREEMKSAWLMFQLQG